MSFAPPPPPPPPVITGGTPGEPVPRCRKPLWRRWWFITICAIVVIGVIGAIAGGGKKDKDADPLTTNAPTGTDALGHPTTVGRDSVVPTSVAASTTVPVSDLPTTQAPTTLPSPKAHPIAGDSITLDGGSLVRVGGVTPNATPLNEFFTPDPGTTFTRFSVEACAGKEGFNANPLYFVGFLDNNTTADVALGGQDFETFAVAPGGCTGGTIDLIVPDGRTLASIAITDPLLREVGRWDTTADHPITGPLASTISPAAVTLGANSSLADGATAVVRTVTPNAPPPNQFTTPAPGNQFVAIDVQLCAGTKPLSVNPLYWLATDTTNHTTGAALGAQTLDTIELAAGQCIAGTVAFEIPSSSVLAYILYTDAGLAEVARWTVS